MGRVLTALIAALQLGLELQRRARDFVRGTRTCSVFTRRLISVYSPYRGGRRGRFLVDYLTPVPVPLTFLFACRHCGICVPLLDHFSLFLWVAALELEPVARRLLATASAEKGALPFPQLAHCWRNAAADRPPPPHLKLERIRAVKRPEHSGSFRLHGAASRCRASR